MEIKSFLMSACRTFVLMVRASLPAVHKARALTPRDWLGIAGHIIAVATAITSTVGIYNFASPLAGDSISYKLLLLPVAIFFGFLFQIVVVSAIKLTVQSLPDKLGAAAACAGVVAVTWCLTVGASYGSYWNWIAKDSYQARATQLQIETAANPLEDVSVKFAAATNAFAQVAGQASAMATLEEAGRSCGYEAGDGKGERWRLRDRQNKEAGALSSQLKTLNQSLRGSLTKMNSDDDGVIADAYRDARSTLLDPVVATAATWVANQRVGFARGFTDNGTVFFCTDPNMSSLLDTAGNSLARLPAVSATPPRAVQISDGQGMLMSFARLFGFGNDALAQDSDFMPFAIPALIEMLMTILIVMGELNRPDEPGPWGATHRPIDPDLEWFARRHAQGAGAARLHEMLSGHIVELAGAPSACFVVPATQGEQRERARALLLMCSSRRRGRTVAHDVLTPFRQHLPFDELPSMATAGWSWRDEHCDVHLLPRKIADEVRRLITRQAEAELFRRPA